MTRQIQKVFPNILLAIGGVLVAFILLEMGARLLPSPFDGPENTADVCSDQLGWRGKPYFKTTVATGDYVHDLALNSAGMHDEEHQRTKPANTFRILMLGDSFIRAHQVKEAETSHQVLENRLNGGGALPHFEVINAGVDGWGTGQELLYYRSEGRFYQPDLVILMFFMDNDIKDNLPGRGITLDGRNCYAPYFVLCENQLDTSPWLYAPGLEPSTGQCSFGKKTLLNTLGQLHQSSRLYAQLEPLLPASRLHVSGLDFYTGENELFDYALQLTLALVKQLREEVKNDGAESLVVLISPSDLIDFSQMSSDEREAVYQKIPAMRRAEQIEPPNQTLAEALSHEGIKVLDLLPLFSRHIDETGEVLHFPDDKHWNVAGNRLAGESIYRWLQENYGLSASSSMK